MSKNALSTIHEFELVDGSKVKMTLAFIKLKMLAAKNKELYNRQMKIMAKGGESEFDTLTVLYAAYVCANLDEEKLMTEDEFIEKCGTDRYAMNEAMQAMTNPKKR